VFPTRSVPSGLGGSKGGVTVTETRWLRGIAKASKVVGDAVSGGSVDTGRGGKWVG